MCLQIFFSFPSSNNNTYSKIQVLLFQPLADLMLRSSSIFNYLLTQPKFPSLIKGLHSKNHLVSEHSQTYHNFMSDLSYC